MSLNLWPSCLHFQVVGLQGCTQLSWEWARGLLRARQAFCLLSSSPSSHWTFSVVIFVFSTDEDSVLHTHSFLKMISSVRSMFHTTLPPKYTESGRKTSDTLRTFNWQTVGYRDRALFFISCWNFPQMLVLRQGKNLRSVEAYVIGTTVILLVATRKMVIDAG